MSDAAKSFLYVGTYTEALPHVSPTAKGIYAFARADADSALEYIDWFKAVPNPSFLAFHPESDLLFSVAEVDESEEGDGGSVASYAIDKATGRLQMVDTHSSMGSWPCHLIVGTGGKHILAANYLNGSLGVIPVAADGTWLEGAQRIQHEGSSVDVERQEGPHAHSINLDPAGQFAIAADLGIDQAKVYRFDSGAGTLTEVSHISVTPGSGPRHFDFHPNGQWAYLLNELAATVTVCHWDGAAGTLTEVQTINTLPADWEGHISTADIHVHPSGKWVYNSNRGHDSITMFAVDPANGQLTLLGQESTRGKTPRNFTLDPEGRKLYAANQDSDTVVVFDIDLETGLLHATGEVAAVPNPVCLKFLTV